MTDEQIKALESVLIKHKISNFTLLQYIRDYTEKVYYNRNSKSSDDIDIKIIEALNNAVRMILWYG